MYRRGDWVFPLSYEWVYEGNSARELNLGVRNSLEGGHSLSLIGILGERPGFEAAGEYRANDSLSIRAGVVHYDERNLSGARNIPSLERGSTYVELFTGLAWVY